MLECGYWNLSNKVLRMTELLEKAFAEASKLPPKEQEALAAWILEELASERRWDEAFASSQDVLSRLADEAIQEHKAEQGRRRLNLPPVKPASPEEIARRAEVVARMRKLRQEIGPVDLTVEDLLAEDDPEDDD
jgi:hypothetical protein